MFWHAVIATSLLKLLEAKRLNLSHDFLCPSELAGIDKYFTSQPMVHWIFDRLPSGLHATVCLVRVGFKPVGSPVWPKYSRNERNNW